MPRICALTGRIRRKFLCYPTACLCHHFGHQYDIWPLSGVDLLHLHWNHTRAHFIYCLLPLFPDSLPEAVCSG